MRGKRVWIIGASHGIGAALARRLAAEGAALTLSGRDAVALEGVRASLAGDGHTAFPLDVTNRDAFTNAEVGAQDIIIYNAGAYDPMGAATMDLNAVERMVAVNLMGAFYLLPKALTLFETAGKGHLVLVASVAGYRGLPNAMGYGASKAGLINLAESLRAELAAKKIKVQVVNPGFVKTRLTEKNNFPMPFATTPEVAAIAISKGLEGDGFEIHFPRRFTYIMKFLAALPNVLYFAITRRMA